MKQSRVSFLYLNLSILGFNKAIQALDLVIEEMSSDRGFRRHDGKHFYFHLVDTTQTLINFGVKDENILTASILHDIVEDVEGITLKYIAQTFGSEIKDYVDRVTKKKGIKYKKNEEKMKEYLDRIEESLPASLIKTADRMHNFSSMRGATPQIHKEKQVENTEKFFIPFFKRCRKRYPQYSSFFFFAKTTIEPLVFEMKENIKLHKEISKLKREK